MLISIVSFGHIDSVSAIAKYLSKSGNTVNLYLIVFDDTYINSIASFNLKNVKSGIHSITSFKGQSKDIDNLTDYLKDVNSVSLVKFPSRSLKDFKNVQYVKEICRTIKAEKSDVVHFNGDSAHQNLFYYYLKGIPKVYTLHDYIPHSGEVKLYHRIKNTFFRKIHFRLKYVFINHSEYQTRLMIEENNQIKDRSYTTYFAPFDFYDYYKNDYTEEDYPSVLFFGRISKYKGLEYFCKAIEIISKSVEGCRFYVLGKGDVDFDLDYYLKNYNIEFINDYIDNATLSKYLQKSSMTVVPYTDATQSGVVFTSYAFDKPVVATRAGGLPEVVIDGVTGFIAEPRDAENLAEKIIELLGNRKLLNSFSENIRKFKKDKQYRFFSWETVAMETEKIYEEAIIYFGKEQDE